MIEKGRIRNHFLIHLRTGTICGIYAGFLLACIELTYLLFHLGNFSVDLTYFSRAILLYSVAGGFVGGVASVFFYWLFFKRTHWTNRKITAIYFSFFLGAGIFVEILFFLMDIYPFGGVNKWSLRTLSIVALGALASVSLMVVSYFLLKRIFAHHFFKASSHKRRIFKMILPLIIFVFSILAFAFLIRIDLVLEKKEITENIYMSDSSHPNIIIILLDSLRADHLSCNGYSLETTPHLDALARQGVLFSSVYATSNWSVPTHASLFTGLYPSSHGAYSIFSALDRNIPTLAEILSKNGYYSLSLYNNPFLGETSALDEGFDSAIGIEYDSKTSLLLERVYKKFIKKASISDDILKMARRWIGHCKKLNTRYFVFLNLFDLHSPYDPVEPYFSNFLSTMETDKVNMSLVNKLKYLPESRKKKLDLLSQLTEKDLAYVRMMYDSNIRYVDELVGNFIEMLKRKGWLDNTLVVITSDHGEFLGEHDYMEHLVSKLYNPGIKIPLILWLPEKLKPRIVEFNISQVDILPTVLSILGLENQIPPGIQGVDVFSKMNKRDVLSEFWDDVENKFARTIISRNMKLIINLDNSFELYNLVNDPGENNNLASLMVSRTEELSKKLELMVNSFKKFKPRIDERKKKELKKLLRSLSYID